MPFHHRTVLSGHASGIYSLASDGISLYSASADKFVVRWNILEGTQDAFTIRFDFPIYSVCLLNDSRFLVAGLSSGDLHVFDVQERKEIRFLKYHTKPVFTLVENTQKGQFYSADSDGTIYVWDTAGFEELIHIPVNCGKIRRITVSSDGNYFACACQDGNLRVFETTSFNEISTFQAHQHGATTVLFHPSDNRILISGGKDAMLRSWDWMTGILLREIPAHNYVIYELLSMNLGTQLVTASRDKTIKIWDSFDFSFIQRIDLKSKGHKHSVNCLVKVTETIFASGSDDRTMMIWEA
jgi:WD40 repeat protein